ncbi:MAG: alpha-L-fucosidase [Clostridiales bacterium]|nr:alpha-L-fucosidase [Clostridiales bacterium]
MNKKYAELAKRASAVVPSRRQLLWQDIDFCAFINFGLNTFIDSEDGAGNVSPDLFDPPKLNVHQWIKAIKLAGMKGVILDVKHYDGFCLWPSAYTDHSVKNSPWLEGKGDLVKEVADQCREMDLKFGIYLALWDRHDLSYGKGSEYDTFVKDLLRELLTNYGDIFCVRLDDFCGEDESIRSQSYDLQGYYDLIRELQPDAVISDCGPDVRWNGNYTGFCRKEEWSVVSSEQYMNRISPLKNKSRVMELDIGSLKAISKADELIWYPAETCIPLRKGWFYHEKEKHDIMPLSKIMEIYYRSVGANSSLLLGVAPTPEGVISENDLDVLLSVGAQLKIDFNENLAEDSIITASCSSDAKHGAEMALTDDPDEYWCSGDNARKPELILDLGDDYDINKIVLKEHIKTGQQIEAFTLYAEINGRWKKFHSGTAIGHKCICRFKETRIQRFKLVIEDMRGFATISAFEAY